MHSVLLRKTAFFRLLASLDVDTCRVPPTKSQGPLPLLHIILWSSQHSYHANVIQLRFWSICFRKRSSLFNYKSVPRFSIFKFNSDKESQLYCMKKTVNNCLDFRNESIFYKAVWTCISSSLLPSWYKLNFFSHVTRWHCLYLYLHSDLNQKNLLFAIYSDMY